MMRNQMNPLQCCTASQQVGELPTQIGELSSRISLLYQQRAVHSQQRIVWLHSSHCSCQKYQNYRNLPTLRRGSDSVRGSTQLVFWFGHALRAWPWVSIRPASLERKDTSKRLSAVL